MFLFLGFIFLHSVFSVPSCPDNFKYNSDLNTCLSNWTFYSSWKSANYYCSLAGYNLVSIHNSRQNSLIAQYQYKQSGDYRVWVGLQKTDQGTWSWTDGTPFDFQNFQPSAPPGLCAYLDGQDQLWKTADCSVEIPFLCSTMPGPDQTTPARGSTNTAPPMTTTTSVSRGSTNAPLTCGPTTTQPLYTCQQGWQYFPTTGFQYLAFNDSDAIGGEAYCVSLGGHLASIHSDAENNFITNLCCPTGCGQASDAYRYGQYVVGGLEQGGSFTWTDGTPWDYQNTMCYDQTLSQEALLISNYVNCDQCGQPGIWYFESPSYVQPYGVCKK